MNKLELKQLYRLAWIHWGSAAQVDMAIEEMAELTHALIKARRKGEIFTPEVIEEIADVSICIEQLAYHSLGMTEKSFAVYRQEKEELLKKRLWESIHKETALR